LNASFITSLPILLARAANFFVADYRSLFAVFIAPLRAALGWGVTILCRGYGEYVRGSPHDYFAKTAASDPKA